jgi:hypothetical protein
VVSVEPPPSLDLNSRSLITLPFLKLGSTKPPKHFLLTTINGITKCNHMVDIILPPSCGQQGGGKHQVPYSSTDDIFGMALHNGKAHYLINGIVISESPNVPAVDYLFGFTMSWLPADNNNAGINVTFVDPLSHWGTLN